MDTRRLLRTPAVAFAAAALLLSGCTSSRSGSGPNPGAGSVDQAALAPYYHQKPAWHACGPSGFQCATMKAPLDYAKPGGAQIKLAVARKRATGPGKRLG